LLTYN